MKKKVIYLCTVLGLLFALQIKTQSQNRIFSLNSSNSTIRWKLEPQSDIQGDSVKIFSPEYNTNHWIQAVVPGTVFASYVDAGLESDPNYADNIYKVDKSKYDRNFWYRTEFDIPAGFIKEKLWLNFNGVNRDADVFVNGINAGSIKGIMQRGKFDITDIVKPNRKNVLAVLVYLPQNPISNGASPTYGSSAGWDWMPYVPGLNSGIQDNVYLSSTGCVSISDPWIKSDLPDLSSANLQIRTELVNHSSLEQKGELQGTIQPGNIHFSLDVAVAPNDTKIVTFDHNGFPELTILNPQLWWPNGYGSQNLYTCDLQFVAGGSISDEAHIKFGIRKLAIDTSNNVMKIFVNNEKIFAKGGNWGMPEYMLRSRGKDYDTRIRLHKDMNFNIIRNWMGSTTDEDFYEACDKYGIMVWDDFWLNSSGGSPRDINVFNANAVEKIKRFRNHPCIVLWCGDNEGEPAPPLNDWLRADVSTFDGRHYHSNSHSYGLSGSGPWRPLEPDDYFMNAAPGHWGGSEGWGMRSEMGTAAFINFESFKIFIPEDKWWPQNEMWNKHFFGNSAVYAGPDDYLRRINNSYGVPAGIKDFCKKAQLLNIETNKAMFEGWLDNLWNDASGLIIWMSQSAYPSMVWQTYDYYFDATGAYWGAKKACEPVHIQWNPATLSVKVINTTLHDLQDMTAEAKVYSLDGTEVPELGKAGKINVKKDSLASCFTLVFPGVDLACKKNGYASTVGVKGEEPSAMFDGDEGTKWESDFGDGQWASVDLGEIKRLNHVRLHWDNSCAKVYKIQLSDDAVRWRDVYYTSEGKPGIADITFNTTSARFVRMYCIEKNTQYRVSLWSFEVYDDTGSRLSDVHFIKLFLKDNAGKLISDNFYWRSKKGLDYKEINTLPAVELKVQSKTITHDGTCIINARITNPASSKAAAFAVHIQVVKEGSGERILPVYMNDNYFTLLRGEIKDVTIEFDETQLGGGEPQLLVEPYNSDTKSP